MSLLEMADATPSTRDRYVDFLRAVSIMVVVLGHWLIAIIYWKDGEVTGQNALDVIPGLWLATWILQVMPVFFFVGGFSNLTTVDSISSKGGGYPDFIHGRVARLMRPTILFLAVWIPVAAAADVFTGLGDDVLESAGTLLTRPLWFLGIYMIMIAFAPPMVRLHRRYGVKVLVAMAVGAIAVCRCGLRCPVCRLPQLCFRVAVRSPTGIFLRGRLDGAPAPRTFLGSCSRWARGFGGAHGVRDLLTKHGWAS